MYDFLINDLKDNPKLIIKIIMLQENMLEYFKQVFEYNQVKDIPKDTGVFWLSYEAAKHQTELALKEIEQLKLNVK